MKEFLNDHKDVAGALLFLVALCLSSMSAKLGISMDQATANDLAQKVVILGAAWLGGHGLARFGIHAAEASADSNSVTIVKQEGGGEPPTTTTTATAKAGP